VVRTTRLGGSAGPWVEGKSLCGPAAVHRQRHTGDTGSGFAAQEDGAVADALGRQQRQVGLLFPQQVADAGAAVAAALCRAGLDLRSDDGVPALERKALDRAGVLDAGVVDQDVGGAQRRRGCGEQSLGPGRRPGRCLV